jgi:hypothetical protein
VAGLKARITRPGRPQWLLLGVAVVVGLGVLLMGFGVLSVSWRWSGDDVRADARMAYCLQDANRPRVVETAVNLRKLHHGSKTASVWPSTPSGRWVTVDTWSSDEREGFDRACSVLVALEAPKLLDSRINPISPAKLLSRPAVTLLLGGLITYLFNFWTARGEHRRTLGAALTNAGAEYSAAALAYMSALRKSPTGAADPVALNTRLGELLGAVQRQPAKLERQRAVIELINRTHGLIAGARKGGWPEHEAVVDKELAGLRSRLLELAVGRADAPVNTPGGGA